MSSSSSHSHEALGYFHLIISCSAHDLLQISTNAGPRKGRSQARTLLDIDNCSMITPVVDKRPSSVERVHQVAKGWPLTQRLGPLKRISWFLDFSSFWLLSILEQFFKLIFCAQKLFVQKNKHTDSCTPSSTRNLIFSLSLMSKSSYDIIINFHSVLFLEPPEL